MSQKSKFKFIDLVYLTVMVFILTGAYIFFLKSGLSESDSKKYSLLILIAACLLYLVVLYIPMRIKIKIDAAKWSKEFNNASDERKTEMLEFSINEFDKELDRAVKAGLISVAELEEIKKKAEASSGAP